MSLILGAQCTCICMQCQPRRSTSAAALFQFSLTCKTGVWEMREFARQALRAAAPLGVVAFWCCLWMAAERYPSEYDWRYMTISSLLYPERNPHGYRWAWGGVAVCGLGGLCWVSQLIWNGRPSGGEARP